MSTHTTINRNNSSLWFKQFGNFVRMSYSMREGVQVKLHASLRSRQEFGEKGIIYDPESENTDYYGICLAITIP